MLSVILISYRDLSRNAGVLGSYLRLLTLGIGIMSMCSVMGIIVLVKKSFVTPSFKKGTAM